MSVESSNSAVELERNSAHLSSVEEQDPPYAISGIAIGEGDVTLGQSGIKKKWTREALKPAAATLEGRPLVVDHVNSAYGVVGEVTRVEYRDGVGVLYEAELDDEDLAEKIENGRLEVSIRGFHGDVEEMEEDDETGAMRVTEMQFDNLSIVPTGAAPSNTATFGGLEEDGGVEASEAPTVEAGPSTEYSAAECAEMLTPDVEEEAASEDDSEEADDAEETAEDSEADEAEEAGENADGQSTETDEQTSPHDDAEQAEQSRGAGTDEEPDSILDNVTFHKNMTDVEDQLSEYEDPHVIEESDLEELREQTSKVEDLEETVEELRDAQDTSDEDASEMEELKEELKDEFTSDLEELKDRTRVLDEVNRDDVEELAERDSPMIVEESDFEELQDSVETVTEIYAESLSEYVGLSAETLAEKMSLEELREELEEQAEAESVEEELSPSPKGDDPEEDELEEAAEDQTTTTTDEDEDLEELREELQSNILDS